MQSGALFLTFDDGPDELWTPRMLEVLDRCGAQATFFLIGERVQATPHVAKAIADAGHEIGLHCQRHIRHTEMDEAEIEADTLTALAALADVGVRPSRWRAPWGVCTPATVSVAERHGLELVHWSIDTHDWRGDSVGKMLEYAAERLTEDAVVLMHDALGPGALRDGCENTLALVAPLLAMARTRELGLGPVVQCR